MFGHAMAVVVGVAGVLLVLVVVPLLDLGRRGMSHYMMTIVGVLVVVLLMLLAVPFLPQFF